MKRSELEKYLGKRVRLQMFRKGDLMGEVLEGYLYSTQDPIFQNNNNLFLKKGYYVVTGDKEGRNVLGFLFRCSYVRRLEKVDG